MSAPHVAKPSAVDAQDQARAAAFRGWVYEHGGLATREPQVFMTRLAALRERIVQGDILPETPEDLLLAGLDLMESVAHHRLANHAAVEPCANRAREAFDRVARETNNPALARELHLFSAKCQLQVGNACYGRAMYADALRAYSAAHERFTLLDEKKGQSTVLRNMGLCYEGSGLMHLAVEAGLAAREIARSIKDEFELATHDNNLGGLYFDLGDTDAARLCLERAQRFFQKNDRGDYELQTVLQLARLSHRLGSTDGTDAWLARAESISQRIDRRELESDRLKVLGTILRERGLRTAAQPALERGAALAREVGDPDRVADLCLELARIALDEGKPAEARGFADEALAASTRDGTEGRLVPDALGALADAARASDDWPSAWRHERARNDATARAQQRAMDARARTLAVRHQLEVVREEAERRRLENLRLEEALARVAARLDSTERGALATPDTETITAAHFRPLGLRPRECEVLLWVVRGKSNDEIGMILRCSAETVKSHLKRIYVRLDVTNRTAAAAHALARLTHTTP